MPRGLRERGAVERVVRIRVAGRGETTLTLRGRAAAGDDGLAAVEADGALHEDAAFDGEPGTAPPPAVGAVRVADVRAEARTSYPAAGPPFRGEFVLTTPYAGGLATRVTTTFTLVLP